MANSLNPMQPPPSKPKGYVPNLTLFTAWGAVMVAIIAVIVILHIVGLPKDWRTTEGFLGTGASRMADLTLLAYILLLVPMMLTGFAFARNKKFVPHHQVMMTTLVLVNWGLISFIMANSFSRIGGDIPDNLDDRFYTLPAVHFLFGFTAQVVGSYLVIRMWFEDSLPGWFKVRKIKRVMRFTLACWLIAATLGVLTYLTWYEPFSDDDDTDITPAATPEVTEDPPQTASPEATQAVTPAATPQATEEVIATEEAAPTETATP